MKNAENQDFRIVSDLNELPLDDVVRLLRTTYWAGHRSPEQIALSMRNSDCYGVRVDGAEGLVGFARVITDRATTYYLCDVVVDPDHRGRGLGKALVSHIVSRPEYAGLRGLLLTRDAHGLYRQSGFKTVEGRAMERSPQ